MNINTLSGFACTIMDKIVNRKNIRLKIATYTNSTYWKSTQSQNLAPIISSLNILRCTIYKLLYVCVRFTILIYDIKENIYIYIFSFLSVLQIPLLKNEFFYFEGVGG